MILGGDSADLYSAGTLRIDIDMINKTSITSL